MKKFQGKQKAEPTDTPSPNTEVESPTPEESIPTENEAKPLESDLVKENEPVFTPVEEQTREEKLQSNHDETEFNTLKDLVKKLESEKESLVRAAPLTI